MGANQQTSVPAFTAGQVLTAQQQTEINTGIPVFADSTARTAAFGGTGEKVLAEGQYSYLEDTNSTEVYDGSSWVAVGSSGLVYVGGAIFSAQTTVAFANDTFTSTYDYYAVMLDAKADATAANVSLQVRDNSTTKSTANYAGGGEGRLFNNTQSSFGVNGATSYALMQATVTNQRCFWQITVANPADAAKNTKWSGTANADPQTGASIGGWSFGGNYGVNEAHTGLVFTFSNASSGLYRVYGYTNS